MTKLDELNDSNNLNNTVDHDQNNAFLQLATLFQSYYDSLKTKNSKDEFLNTGTTYFIFEYIFILDIDFH